MGGDGNNRLYGEEENDLLYGGNGFDFLHGNVGNDRIDGGADRDYFYGDEGNDTLTEGTGNNRFVFRSKFVFSRSTVGIDTIIDFNASEDTIIFDLTTFAALPSWTGDRFSNSQEFVAIGRDGLVAASKALIVFSSGSGNLFYSENGSDVGLGSGGHFAKLTDTSNLLTNNFQITY